MWICRLVNNAVFWDVAPCCSCVDRRFGGTYRHHLQGRKIRERGTSVSKWLHSDRLENLKFYMLMSFWIIKINEQNLICGCYCAKHQ
jgi:hypothetical protein